MGIKADSGLYSVLKARDQFALSFLATGQKGIAFAFFKPTTVDGQTINGQQFETHQTGAPVISEAAAWIEGRIVREVEMGDRHAFAGEITNAAVKQETRLLTLEECGGKYGGFSLAGPRGPSGMIEDHERCMVARYDAYPCRRTSRGRS